MEPLCELLECQPTSFRGGCTTLVSVLFLEEANPVQWGNNLYALSNKGLPRVCMFDCPFRTCKEH